MGKIMAEKFEEVAGSIKFILASQNILKLNPSSL